MAENNKNQNHTHNKSTSGQSESNHAEAGRKGGEAAHTCRGRECDESSSRSNRSSEDNR